MLVQGKTTRLSTLMVSNNCAGCQSCESGELAVLIPDVSGSPALPQTDDALAPYQIPQHLFNSGLADVWQQA